MALLDNTKKYRYKDIASWEGSWELIEGIPYNMTPAPLRIHQKIVGDLHAALYTFLQKSDCEVYVAPFDVRFSEDEDYDNPDTVVQPDLSVFCNRSQLDKKGGKGAPTLIIEVLSKSTASKDKIQKFRLYEKHGVQSYWMVQPEYNVIEVFNLVDGSYQQPTIFTVGQTAHSPALEGFKFIIEEMAD